MPLISFGQNQRIGIPQDGCPVFLIILLFYTMLKKVANTLVCCMWEGRNSTTLVVHENFRNKSFIHIQSIFTEC